MNCKKQRIDNLLVEKKLAQSRTKAQAYIMAGVVIVNDQVVTKSGVLVPTDATIRIKLKEHNYVSRSALKLKAALEKFDVNLKGLDAMDIGASTGGFTEILIEHEILKVYSVDVGHSQLDWKIRSHTKVIVLEKTNARTMAFEVIGQKIDVIVIDVSFISLTKILENLKQFSKTGKTQWIALIKPQFEVGPDKVGKGGLVLDEAVHKEVIQRVKAFAENIGLKYLNLLKSPLKGTDGNQEYLIHLMS